MTTLPTPNVESAAPTPIVGFGRVAVITEDLGRFRTFYEGLLGLPHVISLRMGHPPFLVHGVFALGASSVLHAFEVPGYDPAADGIPSEIGRRGRIDHFALLVDDEPALLAVRDRLVSAGASDGAVTSLGPFLSVLYRDPDGLEGNISCPNHNFDPSEGGDEVVECSVGPQWTSAFLAR